MSLKCFCTYSSTAALSLAHPVDIATAASAKNPVNTASRLVMPFEGGSGTGMGAALWSLIELPPVATGPVSA